MLLSGLFANCALASTLLADVHRSDESRDHLSLFSTMWSWARNLGTEQVLTANVHAALPKQSAH
jgi:hypothetical protein